MLYGGLLKPMEGLGRLVCYSNMHLQYSYSQLFIKELLSKILQKKCVNRALKAIECCLYNIHSFHPS